MCLEALPEHLKDPKAWKGTDHDTWWSRWFIPLKLKYLCFGPRDSHTWHKWREWPITLFKIGAYGYWRFENDLTDGTYELTPSYLSRIQYWKRWHFQIQWPFFIAFHWYFRRDYVPKYGCSRDSLDNKLVYFYFGAHRDADKVYWVPSCFIGFTWK